MSIQLKDLSAEGPKKNIDISEKYFGLVISQWNNVITSKLQKAAVETLLSHGAQSENIFIKAVPGSYELSLGAQWMASRTDIDAVLCLGCVIQGETRHFDFICQAVAHGLTEVALKFNKPVIFGVLTPNTLQQAEDRAGGKYGNKGTEAALTAIEMLGFDQV